MNNNFQRKGSSSNTQVGNDFEDLVQAFFISQGITVKKNIPILIGINKNKKSHRFDLGNETDNLIIECKSHTWTESGNVPSAKITTWDQAMFYFLACPEGYRKVFMVLRDFSSKRNETLCEYYLRTKAHLIPDDVEIWEFDQSSVGASRKK